MAATSRNDDDEMISGINVTPLVDITLVLLIIFMVTAKIIVSQSLPLDLPKAAQGQEVQLIFGLELHANGDTLADGKKLASEDAILPIAREAQAKNPELRAVIRADTTVPHGRVIRALDLLKQAGVSKIAFGVTPIAPEAGAAPGTAPGSPAAPPPAAPAPATPSPAP
ncbi:MULTISPECIES: ExbD/TolR family protein [Sorangium]|uniref:Biopolymer transport protein (ExbD-like) n=1 Tax=Sorangium cellulosum (strain So ce56) TaxID=448385 RepID=A9F2E6_SORC5|nr:biopolymer transporter ExbD [Sorangium cellulosum]CAN94479.1 putative biopolymer transport protein (ExbD-like) [Sorangium cellulosum So ce56]